MHTPLPAGRHITLGGDPRSYTEFAALREEINKLQHPARPDVDWARVEQLCLTLFRQNGVDLQTAVDYALARMQRAGLEGADEGLTLLDSLIAYQWCSVWPAHIPARVELLAWLSSRMQQVWRTLTLTVTDLPALYRIEQTLDRLCGHLQTLELRHLTKLDGVRHLVHSASLQQESQYSAPGEAAMPADPSFAAPKTSPTEMSRSEPLIYIVPAATTQQQVPRLRWRVGHGFLAGTVLTALVMGAGLSSWQWLQTNPAQETLLATVQPLPQALTSQATTALLHDMEPAIRAALAEPVLIAEAEQLQRLQALPPLWAQQYGDSLIRQAQQLWPDNPDMNRMAQAWQTQRVADAADPTTLDGYYLAQTRLQQLANKLNNLDEPRGRYMTVSELKSAVFAIQQPLTRQAPMEELLRQYQELQSSGAPSPALRQQIDGRFRQLLNQYALLVSLDRE
ncbi:VasL domain-containing protein [Pseudomonas sp.]